MSFLKPTREKLLIFAGISILEYLFWWLNSGVNHCGSKYATDGCALFHDKVFNTLYYTFYSGMTFPCADFFCNVYVVMTAIIPFVIAYGLYYLLACLVVHITKIKLH